MNRVLLSVLMLGAAAAATAASAAPIPTINLDATNYAASTFTQSFGPGDYTVSLAKGLYTAWAPATPSLGNWTDYYKYTIGGVETIFNPLNSKRFTSADDAFNAYSAAPQLSLSFSKATDVTFAIADYPTSFGDNSGGVSLNVAAVPEAASWAMMVMGFGAVGFAMRRRRAPAVSFG